MPKKMKGLSVLLVLIFMLQSILIPAVYAMGSSDVIMEMSVPQPSLTNSSNAANAVESVNPKDSNGKVIAESNVLTVTTAPAVTTDLESAIQPYGQGTLTGSAVDLNSVKQSANTLTMYANTMGTSYNLLSGNMQADSITNSGTPTGGSQFKVYANNVTGGVNSVKFRVWTQDGGRNLISNSSFNDSTTSGWAINNGTDGTSQVVSNGWGGNKALEAKVASGGDQFQFTSFNHGVNIGGRTFTYSIYIKTEGIQGTGVGISSYWSDSTGNWLSQCWSAENKSQRITGTNDWTRLTVTTTAPQGAYNTTLIVYPTDKNGSGKYWISAAMMEENSQATAYVNGKTRNILSNSSFNDGTTNRWGINNATGGTNQIISNSWQGNNALEIKVASGGDQYQLTNFGHGVDVGGRTFTYSLYVKTEGIQGAGIGISSYWSDSTGNWLPECWTSENKSQRITGTNGWTRVTVTTTAPKGTYYTTLLVYPIDKNGAGKYWISAAMMEEGANATPYVNGTGVYEQDDAKWYDGINTGDNNWNSTINIFNHFNESGKYIVEAYAYDNNGNRTYIGGTTAIYSFETVKTTNLVLKLKNVKSFANRVFTITYNTSAISGVVDLCGFTYQKELSTGAIAGTGITILQNDAGIIKFTIGRDIPDGKAWSGTVNIFKFKLTGNGEANFNCKVE